MQYTGRDNLDIMEMAARYNQSIVSDIIRVMPALGEPKEQDPLRVVDFGAGKGLFASMLHRSAGVSPLCVEPDPILSSACAAKGFMTASDLSMIPDQSADFLYSLNVLEHIQDDLGTLREFHRVLRPNGLLYLYVPAFPCLYSSMDRKVGHFRRYRWRPMESLLRTAGFQVHTDRYADSLGFLASYMYRFVGPDTGDIDPRSLVFYDRWIFPFSRRLDLLLSAFFGKNLVVTAWAQASSEIQHG